MESIKAIIKWHGWIYNHDDIKETFEKIYPKWLADHFYAKFDGNCKKFNGNTWMAITYLFFDMTVDNQAKLAEWVCENYHGFDNILKQLEN